MPCQLILNISIFVLLLNLTVYYSSSLVKDRKCIDYIHSYVVHEYVKMYLYDLVINHLISLNGINLKICFWASVQPVFNVWNLLNSLIKVL